MATETTFSTTAAPAPSASSKAPASKQEATVESLSRVGRAEAIIHRNFLWSLGAGLLPLPLLDMVLASGVQVKMLKELSDLYEVKFSESLVKKLLTALVSSLGGVTIGAALGVSIAKLIPFVGTSLGIAASPVAVGTFTYATGRVFLMHFESGGTFLDFDPHAMRKHFKDEFEKAKETVAQVHKDEHAKTASKLA